MANDFPSLRTPANNFLPAYRAKVYGFVRVETMAGWLDQMQLIVPSREESRSKRMAVSRAFSQTDYNTQVEGIHQNITMDRWKIEWREHSPCTPARRLKGHKAEAEAAKAPAAKRSSVLD